MLQDRNSSLRNLRRGSDTSFVLNLKGKQEIFLDEKRRRKAESEEEV